MLFSSSMEIRLGHIMAQKFWLDLTFIFLYEKITFIRIRSQNL